MLLPSRLPEDPPCRPGLWVGVRPVDAWHTWRASPLILFSPRKPLVLALLRSCCRKAFSPVGQRQACEGLPAT